MRPPAPPRALSLLLISTGRHRSRRCRRPRTQGVTAAGVGAGQGAEQGTGSRHLGLASPGARRREPWSRAGAAVPGGLGHASRQECAHPAGAGGSGSRPRPRVISWRGGRRRADVCELLSSERAAARAGRWRRRWRWPPAPQGAEVSAGTRAAAWPRGSVGREPGRQLRDGAVPQAPGHGTAATCVAWSDPTAGAEQHREGGLGANGGRTGAELPAPQVHACSAAGPEPAAGSLGREHWAGPGHRQPSVAEPRCPRGM